MQFVNPVSTQADVAINAINLTGGGTASGSTSIAGQLLVGNPAAAHVIIGTDANGADGVRVYAVDGITPLVDLRADGGTNTFLGAVAIGSTVPGSTVTGSVANATLAANATAATTATNLGGGGTAAGATAITGELTVGTVGGLNSWVVIGTDGSGADGVRLYKAGAVAIDLTIAGTPTITGALIRTAASGARWEMSSATVDSLKGFTGAAAEISPALIQSQDNGFGTVGQLFIAPSDYGNAGPQIALASADTSANRGHIYLNPGTAGTALAGTVGVFGEVIQLGGKGWNDSKAGAWPFVTWTSSLKTLSVPGSIDVNISGAGRTLISGTTGLPTFFGVGGAAVGAAFVNNSNNADLQFSNTNGGAVTLALGAVTGIQLQAASDGAIPMFIQQHSNTQTGALTRWTNFNTSTVLAAITAGGNVQGTGAYTTLSDERVKSNVVPLRLEPADVIRRLRPVHFTRRDSHREEVGFSAQNVAEVLPPAATRWDSDTPSDTGLLGIQSEAILAYLVAAVQPLLDDDDTYVHIGAVAA